MEGNTIGILAALGSSASWAVGSILFKRIGTDLSSSAMTLAKGALSVVLLSLAVLVTGLQPVAPGPLLLLVISGVIGIGLGDSFFFEALKQMGAHALVIMMMLGQVLTALLAIPLLGERPTLLSWGGIALVLFGVGLVLWQPQADGNGASARPATSRRGLVFGLLTVVCLSGSLIIAKQGLAGISALQGTWIRMAAGTVAMLGFGLTERGRLRGWIAPFRDPILCRDFTVSVAVITFGGFWLSLLALKHLDVAIANTLSSTEPVFVLPLAVLLLGERVSRRAILGTGVTMAGVVLLCSAR
jgi:drug/metabolite transporter (DMT)-like permease